MTHALHEHTEPRHAPAGDDPDHRVDLVRHHVRHHVRHAGDRVRSLR